MKKVACKTTRYGLSPRVGGWDKPGDDGTDAWRGLGIPDAGYEKLTTASCALCAVTEKALADQLPTLDSRRLFDTTEGNTPVPGRLKPGTLIKVTWDDGRFVQYRSFDDRAPENDSRCDLFYPWKDELMVPDNGYVELV
jgi:hypothetical protein